MSHYQNLRKDVHELEAELARVREQLAVVEPQLAIAKDWVEQAVAAERERCAKIAEGQQGMFPNHERELIATAIRTAPSDEPTALAAPAEPPEGPPHADL